MLALLGCRGSPADDLPAGQSTDASETTTTVDVPDGDAAGESDASGADAASTGGDDACTNCVESPGNGWLGPVARAHVADPEQAPDCPDGFGTRGPTVAEGLVVADTPVCECSCTGDPSEGCMVHLRIDPQLACTPPGPMDPFVAQADCQAFDATGSVFAEMEAIGAGGSCFRHFDSELPTPTWSTHVVTCAAGPQASSCPTGACPSVVPPGYAPGLCIYREGESDCPDGSFSARSVYYTSVADTRSCSDCDCDSQLQACEQTQLLLYDTPDCAGEPQEVHDGECVPASATALAIVQPPQTTCAVAEQSVLLGQAVPSGPFTFCCTE